MGGRMTDPGVLAFERHYGLPHPCWESFAKRLDKLDAEAQQVAWRAAVETWLTELARALSVDAMVYASERVLLLGSAAAEPLTTFAEKTLVYVDRLLDGIGSVERSSPHVIIVFDSIERYYDYVDYYHTESGEYGASAGMFVNHGYPQTVVGPGEPSDRRATIAHELTHDYLSNLELPRWIEEGLAQLVEQYAAGYQSAGLNREQQQRHRDHWSSAGLEPFWTGEAFGMPDESQELAYQLALTLIRSIISDAAEKTAEFVRQAHYSDAGEAAAQQVFGHSLVDYVGAFTGPPERSGT